MNLEEDVRHVADQLHEVAFELAGDTSIPNTNLQNLLSLITKVVQVVE